MIAQATHADAASFQRVRPRLFGIAYRVLRNACEADDVVQDAWIRWQGTDRDEIRDPAAFLATMTARLALTVGQSARVRREIACDPPEARMIDLAGDPARIAEQAEAIEDALLELLEKLSPSERAAYILREAFDYPHRRIAAVLDLTDANARQLATRARMRLSSDRRRHVDPHEHRELLDTFVAAAQTGDLAALERLLVADTFHAHPCAHLAA
jgi:RNA polymerase sigma-70 factor (ECF subfamily)